MGKGKILIVEDDRDIVEMVEYNLKDEGYETLPAFDGEKGVELAKRQRPDLIILDIMLPVVDGLSIRCLGLTENCIIYGKRFRFLTKSKLFAGKSRLLLQQILF